MEEACRGVATRTCKASSTLASGAISYGLELA